MVTCVLPTRDRPQFIRQAIWYFLCQDYPAKELIVVDDGERPIGDLLPDDAGIRYLRLDRRTSLGAKRNLGCAAAAGELIAHLDDDDWMAPDRLRLQVEALGRAGADACGLRPLLHYRIESGEAYLHDDPRRPRWVAPGTLVYRRAAWRAHPFPELEVGEGEAFLAALGPGRVLALDARQLYVALIHRGNATPIDLTSAAWQRRPIEEVGRLLDADREFYVRLRNGTSPPVPERGRGATSVTVGGSFLVYEGYGSMAELAVLGMARAGAAVNLVPFDLVRSGATPELLAMAAASNPEPDAPVLYYSWPRPYLARFRNARELFFYTMVESSRVPASWVPDLNRARCVVVPTRFLAGAFRESGVTVPIEVVPLGVDPAIYHHLERPPRPGLTTLIVGTVEDRKHTVEGIAAWKVAFAGDASARLIIKARFQFGNYRPDDARIVLIDDNETSRGIAHWYREADVLLALGNEGFGLPLVEGMATGLPVIALDAEGQGDTCADAAGLLLPVPAEGYRRYSDAQWGDCGVRAYPSVAAIADRLRWVAEHRAEARELGRRASEWVLSERNIWDHGPALLEVMERHLSPPRRLRRLPHLWVSSWGKPCGVAEFTKYLQAELPEASVGCRAPDPGQARLVHLQHESTLYQDAPLAGELARLRQAGVPLVVTEHTVSAGVRSWEREADVLVAMTGAGCDFLRTKWPGKRVEHIPHGCHEYFPARKRSRGKVIAAFGFPANYKGFDRLRELQLAVPGSELLILSHDRGEDAGERLPKAADGLPVRWIADYLPSEEIVARLAAEADVLVFWYEPVGAAIASGAVRLGLASGVPVLASPTAWFSDLKEVTYQPTDPVEGVRRLLEDTELRTRLVNAAEEFCHENRWPRIAQLHRELWQSLETA
jgi:glycosyltransferase involved in cell wall biosynthesis